MGAVERYLEALAAHDWEALGRTLTSGEFERIGPFADVISDKGRYIEFLANVLSSMANYRLPIRRITTRKNVVLAEINESFELGGKPMDFPEALIFDLDEDGLIKRVQVYLMRPGERPVMPEGGAARSGDE
jgi:SnoaL-like protein